MDLRREQRTAARQWLIATSSPWPAQRFRRQFLRVHHPRAFREREKAFPLYAAALRWERENLNLLLRG